MKTKIFSWILNYVHKAFFFIAKKLLCRMMYSEHNRKFISVNIYMSCAKCWSLFHTQKFSSSLISLPTIQNDKLWIERTVANEGHWKLEMFTRCCLYILCTGIFIVREFCFLNKQHKTVKSYHSSRQQPTSSCSFSKREYIYRASQSCVWMS